MTHDPSVETDRAKTALARRLAPYVQAETAARLAAECVDGMLAEGWRPPLDVASDDDWRRDRRKNRARIASESTRRKALAAMRAAVTDIDRDQR